MLNNPWVAALTVFMAGLVVLAALGAITYLAHEGRGTEAIGALILGVLGLVIGRLRKIESQTNGTTSRLLDAALPTTVDTSTVDGAGTVAPQQRRP